MPGNMTLAVLRNELQGEVDETLLRYVATNAHKVLYISLEQLCERAAVSEEQVMEFFRAFNVVDFVHSSTSFGNACITRQPTA